MGSFGLVGFSRWPDRSGTKAPQATAAELLETMAAVGAFAKSVGEGVVYVDNAIWLLCAKMGLHLTNEELAGLGQRASASAHT